MHMLHTYGDDGVEYRNLHLYTNATYDILKDYKARSEKE